MGEGAGQLAQAEGPCSSPVPGMTVMVFRARSTRKVLSAEMLPKSTNSVRYLGGGWGQGLCQSQGVGNGAERAPERGFPRNPCIWGYRGDARGQVRDHRLLLGPERWERHCRGFAETWGSGKGSPALPVGGGLGARSYVLCGGHPDGQPPSQTRRVTGPGKVQPTVCMPDHSPAAQPRRVTQPTQLPSPRPGPLPSLASASRRPPGAPAHAIMMTLKSSQFQGSRRNVKSSMQKPRARILMRDSKV